MEITNNKENYFSFLYGGSVTEFNQLVSEKLLFPLLDETNKHKDVIAYIHSMGEFQDVKTKDNFPYRNYVLEAIDFDGRTFRYLNENSDPKENIVHFFSKFVPFGKPGDKDAELVPKEDLKEVTSKRSDFGIVDENGKHVLYPFKNDDLSDLIYLSYNDTLDFTKETGTRSSFTLLRAKINCVMFMSNNFTKTDNRISVGG